MANSAECGLKISNSLIVEDPHTIPDGAATESQQRTREALNRPSHLLSPKPALPKHKLDEQEDLRSYRRVRLRLTQRRFRLKVYELVNDDWHDFGTGFGQLEFLRVFSCFLSYHFRILILSQHHAYITVVSEDDPDHTIFNGTFDRDCGVQRQGGKREALHFVL